MWVQGAGALTAEGLSSPAHSKELLLCMCACVGEVCMGAFSFTSVLSLPAFFHVF